MARIVQSLRCTRSRSARCGGISRSRGYGESQATVYCPAVTLSFSVDTCRGSSSCDANIVSCDAAESHSGNCGDRDCGFRGCGSCPGGAKFAKKKNLLIHFQ